MGIRLVYALELLSLVKIVSGMAKDIFHDIVVLALRKEGWEITHDPLEIRYEEDRYQVDLGAERLIAAEKGPEKIAIEIKSFLSPSTLYAYHAALGQYRNYRLLLHLVKEDRELYLAMPSDTYKEYFTRSFGKISLEIEKVNLVVFSPAESIITHWIRHDT